MSASLFLKVNLGPLVTLEVRGDNCQEISDALKGHEELNKLLNNMCSELAENIYQEGLGEETEESEAQK